MPVISVLSVSIKGVFLGSKIITSGMCWLRHIVVCKSFDGKKASWFSQTAKIKHMKFFTSIINNIEHFWNLPHAFANCDTILLYYNSIGIHWILWSFPFTPKFFSHCRHLDSLIFPISTNTTKHLVFLHY